MLPTCLLRLYGNIGRPHSLLTCARPRLSPALHISTIHRKISNSSLLVGNSWPNFGPSIDMHQTPALAPLYVSIRFIVINSRPNPRYRHVLDLGFSPAPHVSTIHREISSSPLIVGNSWPNFGHSIDMHLTSAQAPLYVSIRFILKFLNSPLLVENSWPILATL